jgi:holin-like protein
MPQTLLQKSQSALRLLFQIAVLSAFWKGGTILATAIHLPFPGAVLALFVLLGLFASGWVSPDWVKAGAQVLLGWMLLFFVPAVLGLLNRLPLLSQYGLRLLAVLTVSCIITMAGSGLIVDYVVHRQERRDNER